MAQDVSPLDRGYDQLPIPFGWFAVAQSDEIAAGEVKTLRYFNTEFVVWRGEDGALRAVDPFCPHLGAHLGYGGQVVGDDLRCPFHHWSFDGEGAVAAIPYTRVVPPKLKRSCLPAWPIREAMGVVFVWNHPRRAAPKWEVASRPEIEAEGWVLAEQHEWVIKIHIQEVTENGQDHAHFGAVHGVKSPPSAEFKIDGWTRRNTVEAKMATPRGLMTGRIDMTAVGPGQSFVRFSDVTDVLMAQMNTPIDAETTQVRWRLYHPPGISEGKMRVTKARMRDLVHQITQDIPIWEHKRYMVQPQLVEGDGPILAYRQQFARYYAFDDPQPLNVAAE